IHSMVGLLPLLAVEIIEPEEFDALPEFKRRVEWFISHRPELARNVASIDEMGVGQRRLLSIVSRERLERILKMALDEDEFLSPYGLRALSRYHKEHPFVLRLDGHEYSVDYEPAESTSGLFGGNSNWRGPVWYPLNYLLIEALQKFHYYYGSTLKVESPTGSGNECDLWEVSAMLSSRLINIFLPDVEGNRPVFGGAQKFNADPFWRDNILFYEYFNGDNGAGIGASHQTGWTSLVAKLIEQRSEYG
ncbi:MAG TPA: glucosidase, partial [Alphaproteobacteria bacterium]|nr:glucosidase [Alphaproteobacteria bacterium]